MEYKIRMETMSSATEFSNQQQTFINLMSSKFNLQKNLDFSPLPCIKLLVTKTVYHLHSRKESKDTERLRLAKQYIISG